MKNFILKFTIIVLLSLIINSCNQNQNMEKLNSLLENVKEKYAPDKRVAIFDVEVQQKNNGILLKGETNLKKARTALTKKLDSLKINYENNINILPSDTLGKNIYGIVNVSVANIRSAPKHSAELATQALLGTVVNILKKKGDWYLVQTPDKYIAWVDDAGIVLADKSTAKEWKESEKVIVTDNYSTLYSADKKVVSDLVLGNTLKLVKQKGKSFVVAFPDGREGIIGSDKVKNYKEWLERIELKKELLVNYAHKFTGIPYLWGGTSMKMLDCSGFTKTLFFMHGIILPRDASQQVHVGKLIDTQNGFENLEAGDLVFFGKKKTDKKKERITHVGMYIGNNKFIHEGGRVKINSFNKDDYDFSEYRLNTFIKAKRIIGNLKGKEYFVETSSFYN